jgi:hypothetical protein
LKESNKQEWSRQCTLVNPFQRDQQEDQRHAGRVMLKKDIQKLNVLNWNTLVQDRRRWKELVKKIKTLH